MVTVGFVVEGASDKRLVESKVFQNWLREKCGLEVVSPVVDAKGNGNMCSRNIETYVEKLRISSAPDKVVVLVDLDPEECAPCITKRKDIIGNTGIDLVVVACKAMESWFLADTDAMRQWTRDGKFFEPQPEAMAHMPWDRLREVGRSMRRGPGTKISFAKKIINSYGFDVRNAASHQNCPSARYFVKKLCALGTG